jgi:hypothetical protein
MEFICYKCNEKLDLAANESIGRAEECPKCFSSIRSCRMCHFYDTTAYNECREPTADRILEKEKSNFCDHYRLGNGDLYKDESNNLLSKANSLFK